MGVADLDAFGEMAERRTKLCTASASLAREEMGTEAAVRALRRLVVAHPDLPLLPFELSRADLSDPKRSKGTACTS